MSTILEQLNHDTDALVETAHRALVEVRTAGGAGAGTIWHPDGLILTAAHVTQRNPMSVVLADGRTLPARLIAYDRERDLAALSVDAAGLPTVRIGDSHLLKPGEWVLALGHPWGILGAATTGVFIGTESNRLGRSRTRRRWLVTNLPLRPGYSGGPLLDAQGRLIGINTMIAGLEVSLAVPVDDAKLFLRERLGSRDLVSAA